MNTQTQNLTQLFQTGVDNGTISAETVQALQVVGIGNLIQGGLGISPDDVLASEVTLVTVVQDDSGSMYSNKQVAIDGHNMILEALQATKQKDGILFNTTLLNSGVINPYNTVDNTLRLDGTNYSPSGSTPLNSTALKTLATVIAKTVEFEDNAVPVRSVTAFLTDGVNTDSTKASEVKRVVEEMLRSEQHIIAGIGIDDGYTDFKKVFSEMGIRDEWILTPKNSQSEVRKAFSLLSMSAIRASQSAATFSQSAMGGFLN